MNLLAEDLLLLALDDTRGTVPMRMQAHLDLGLAGAMIADMAGLGRLQLRKNFWGEKLTVTDASAVDNRLLADAIAAVTARPGKSIGWWVHNLSRSLGGLRRRLLEQLVACGTLERRDERVLLLFHRAVYPERDGAVERDIRRQLDTVLLQAGDPEPHVRWLIQLASACNVIHAIYSGKQRREAEKRVKMLAREDLGSETADAVAKVIAAQQAAVMAAIMASTVAATSAACSASSGASC